MHYVYLTCPVFLSLTTIFHAGMHITIIVIPNLQKQMCIKTVAKIGLLLKIRQSKSFVIKHSDILITGDSSYSMLLPVPPLQQLGKYMSAVIFPLFHLNVSLKSGAVGDLFKNNDIYNSLEELHSFSSQQENLSFK